MRPSQEWVTVREISANEKWSLNGGPFGSKLVSKDYEDQGVPVIRGTNLPFERRFSEEDFVYVSVEKAQNLFAHTARPGDIVFTQRGTLGQVGFIPYESQHQLYVISQSQMKLTVNQDLADPVWVYYYFRQPAIIEELIGLQSSSGVPHINLTTLREFKLPLPPLPTQRKIAAILSAYDDLIENNTRRVQVLEQMARDLYREWFVEFRFPGHEQAEFVEDEHGRRPEGWARMPFASVASYINGFAFKPEHWGTEGQPIIKIKELKAGVTGSTPRCPPETVKSLLRVQTGDILFSWSADLDAYIWMCEPGLLNQHVFRVIPNPGVRKEFLFHALKQGMERFRSLSLGATMQHIKRSALDQVFTLLPNGELQAQMADIVAPIHEQIINLTIRNANLRRTRDLLLPKLVSGELDVSALDVRGPGLEPVGVAEQVLDGAAD